jgi:hypothetical protein
MEDDDRHRIQFDATLDEVVDASMRLTTRTQAFRQYRARAVWITGGCLAAALLATVLYRRGQVDVPMSAAAWGILVAVALLLGAVFGYSYGLSLEWSMRRQYRRMVVEHLGGVMDVRCDIELRREGVRAVQNGVETMFPWNKTAGVEDTGDAIELRFRPGLVVVRNRAFRDETERTRFLELARAGAREFQP